MPQKFLPPKKDTRTKSKKQKEFLAKLVQYVSLVRTCRAAKICDTTVYRWLKTDKAFTAKYTEACKTALQTLEDEAVRRAFEGAAKPVYYGGKKIGTVREFSDMLLLALLKAKAPEKYRDRPGDGNSGKALRAPKTPMNIKWGDKEITI